MRPASVRRSALVRNVFREAAFAERLEHAGDGARRDAERLGQLARRGGGALLGGSELVDRFDVVFDREAGHGRRGQGTGDRKRRLIVLAESRG